MIFQPFAPVTVVRFGVKGSVISHLKIVHGRLIVVLHQIILSDTAVGRLIVGIQGQRLPERDQRFVPPAEVIALVAFQHSLAEGGRREDIGTF